MVRLLHWEYLHCVCITSNWSCQPHLRSSTLSLRENIEKVLEVDLACARAEWTRQDRHIRSGAVRPECAICYCAQLAGVEQAEEPSKRKREGDDHQQGSLLRTSEKSFSSGVFMACLNQKCDKLFHHECVKRWLLSLSDVKKSFGVFYGVCPYCGDTLEVRE